MSIDFPVKLHVPLVTSPGGDRIDGTPPHQKPPFFLVEAVPLILPPPGDPLLRLPTNYDSGKEFLPSIDAAGRPELDLPVCIIRCSGL